MLTQEELEYIKRELGREPNDVEKAMFEAQWSEHCSYKSSKIHLKKLKRDVPWVVSKISDAPLIDLGKVYVTFRIESHNHPSAVDPYNGAATGVGGIIRDILSTGAKPIALLDDLVFGNPNHYISRWHFVNVVKGISDYGNRVGVPTVGGEVWFDDDFKYNPMVSVVCVGILPKDKLLPYRIDPSDLIIIAGSYTGRDGLLGSSFASKVLKEESKEEYAAIQVPDPLLEKLLIDAILELRDRKLVKFIKDLGGGGLATAISESADEFGLGAVIHLERLHLREKDMQPWEIMVSESQERMLLVVSKDNLEDAISILKKYDVPYSVIGEYTADKVIRVYFKGTLVAEIPTSLLANAPPIIRKYRRPEWHTRLERFEPINVDIKDAVRRVILSPNVVSKQWVYSQYDHEVQIRTYLRPGEGDAAVLRIYEDDPKAIAITTDSNPRYTFLDPLLGAASTFLEAYRNVCAVGAKPLAAVDQIDAGSPELEDRYWFFVRMVDGLALASREMNVPIVGGKVSFYNENEIEGKQIKPLVMISMIGLIENFRYAKPLRAYSDDWIVVLGKTYPELGGSELQAQFSKISGKPPLPRFTDELRTCELVRELTKFEEVSAIHDVAVGGLITALFEMTLTNGFKVSIKSLCNCTPLEILFSESGARYVIATKDPQLVLEKARAYKVPAKVIGKVGGGKLVIDEVGEVGDAEELGKEFVSVMERIGAGGGI